MLRLLHVLYGPRARSGAGEPSGLWSLAPTRIGGRRSRICTIVKDHSSAAPKAPTPNRATQSQGTLLCTPALRAESAARRILALRAGLEPGRLDKARRRIAEAGDQLAGVPLHLDDDPYPAVSDIRYRCRRLKAGFGLGLVVVDHVGLIARRTEDQTQLPQEVIDGIHGVAREMDVALIVALHEPPETPLHSLFEVPDVRLFIGQTDAVLVVDETGDRIQLLHNRWGECGEVEAPHPKSTDRAEEEDLLPC